MKKYTIRRNGKVQHGCETTASSAEKAIEIHADYHPGVSIDELTAKETPEVKETPDPVYQGCDYDPMAGSEDECIG